MSKRKHYDEIDALKGIAIFLVILGHSIILYPVNLHENKTCLAIFEFISDIHMPLFFIISGYNFNYYGNYKEYIIKKVKRLLVPYFAFNLLEIIPRLLLPSFINKQIGIQDFVVNMFFYGGNYWFIYTLFIIYLIFPIVTKKKDNIAYCLIIIISLLLNIYNPGYDLFSLNLVFRYLIYFAIGYVTSMKLDVFNCPIITNNKRILLLILSVSLWIILFINEATINVTIYPLLIAIIGTISMYLLVTYRPVVQLFKELGQYSLPLFLMNGFALVVSRTIICMFTENPVLIIGFNLLFNIFVPLLIIRYFFMKNKYLRALIGQ